MEEEIKAAEPQPSVPPSKRTKRRKRRKKAKVTKKLLVEKTAPGFQPLGATSPPDVPEKKPEPEPKEPTPPPPPPEPPRINRPVAVLRPRQKRRQKAFLDNGAEVTIVFYQGDGTRFEIKHNQILISTPSAGDLPSIAAPRASEVRSGPRSENPSVPSGSDAEFLPPMTPAGVDLEVEDAQKLAEFLAAQEKKSGGF